MKDTTYRVSENYVVAPDDLDISVGMSNEKAIARWWADVKLYVRTMDGLDRAVLIVLDEDAGYFHLSSHPNEVDCD